MKLELYFAPERLLPGLKDYVENVMQKPPVAAALERERVKLDTYKAG